MNFLHEIFYTLFPYAVSLVEIPLMLIQWVFDLSLWKNLSILINNQTADYAFNAFLRAFFFGVGTLYVITLSKVIFNLVQSKLQTSGKKSKVTTNQLSPTVQGSVLILSILIALTGEFLLFWFQDSIVLPEMFGTFIIVPYLITLSLGLLALLFFAIRFIFQKIITLHSPWIEKIKVAILILVGIAPLFIVGVIFVEIFANPLGNPQATRFAALHAAIKNTCFIHPERLHCPTTLEEISYIEPKNYESMINSTQASYQYYPEENNYTFIVRYAPTRAVIFDQRLVPLHGVDFKEYNVQVFGTDRISNPPDFLEEVTFEEWQY